MASSSSGVNNGQDLDPLSSMKICAEEHQLRPVPAYIPRLEHHQEHQSPFLTNQELPSPVLHQQDFAHSHQTRDQLGPVTSRTELINPVPIVSSYPESASTNYSIGDIIQGTLDHSFKEDLKICDSGVKGILKLEDTVTTPKEKEQAVHPPLIPKDHGESSLQLLNSVPINPVPHVQGGCSRFFIEDIINGTLYSSGKEELLRKIAAVDREASRTESAIAFLKKKEQKLANEPNEKGEDDEKFPFGSNQTLAQKIYTENRRKAKVSHEALLKLGPKVTLPVYNQPCDAIVCHVNRTKYLLFKEKLVEHLRKERNEREARQANQAGTYSQLMQQWHDEVKKIELSAKWKAKEAKNREIFEKVFPLLKKQRGEQNRLSSSELEEKRENMRLSAVIPPLLLDNKQRRFSYINNNGKIEDFAAEYKERQLSNIWTKAEVDIFKEKILQQECEGEKYRKNFAVISSFLDRKSTSDCVQFYYLSKKEQNYKQMHRKLRRRPNRPQIDPSLILSYEAGVKTRQQREQLQKIEQSTATVDSSSTDCDTSTVEYSSDKENDSPRFRVDVTIVDSK